jgi:GWxTD domain-containing protein
MKMFYYNFWVNRNMQNPIAAYNAYELQLKEVNNAFGLAYKYGFETARGRTYLQYGPPNSINKTTQSADMLPYEIWDYYSLGNQRNIKFVFYAKDRSTNEYELAFTNKRGEVSDPNWMNKIQNTPSSRNFDNNTLLQNTGNTFDRDFNQIIGK